MSATARSAVARTSTRFGAVRYRVVPNAEVPRRMSPHMAMWADIVLKCVKNAGKTLILEQLGGRTQRQAAASVRGFAQRHKKLLRGMRLTVRCYPDGVYVRAVKAGARGWNDPPESGES